MDTEFDKTFFVIVRENDQEIIGSASSPEQAEAIRLDVQRASGEAHHTLAATRELAENFSDWAWRVTVVSRGGQETELAIVDR